MRPTTIVATALLLANLGCTPATENPKARHVESARFEADIQAILDFEQQIVDRLIGVGAHGHALTGSDQLSDQFARHRGLACAWRPLEG